MKITRTHPFTGEVNTKDLPITEKQYEAWVSGQFRIQDIMPNLSNDDREFIKTGITDWDKHICKDEDQ